MVYKTLAVPVPVLVWIRMLICNMAKSEMSLCSFFLLDFTSTVAYIRASEAYILREGATSRGLSLVGGGQGGWDHGKFEEKYELADCLDRPRYNKDVEGYFNGQFWHFATIKASKHFFSL